jgi:hypothetical protein
MLSTRFLVSVLVLVFTLVPPVRAAEPRQHGRGFLARILVGGGNIESENEAGAAPSVDFSVGTLVFDAAVGATVSPNFAVRGTMSVTSSPNADLMDSSGDNGTDRMLSWGGGLTYYFMPINIYVSGNMGAAQLKGRFAKDEDFDSDWGYALNFVAGKEWWLGDGTAIGLAGAFGYHSIPDSDVHEEHTQPVSGDWRGSGDWTGTNWSILLSLTFN